MINDRLICTMNRIDTIIFDLGGVLIDWNPKYLYEKIFDDPAEMEFFLTKVCNSEWNQHQDAGRPFKEAIEKLSKKHPAYKIPIAAYFDQWPEMIGGPIHQSVELLETLADKKYRLFALSNWSAETFPLVEKRFGFFSKFQGTVISGREQVTKPDPRIYELLISRHHITPEETVFIDDNPDNIRTAVSLGFHGIHFTSGPVLAKSLNSLGVA